MPGYVGYIPTHSKRGKYNDMRRLCLSLPRQIESAFIKYFGNANIYTLNNYVPKLATN